MGWFDSDSSQAQAFNEVQNSDDLSQKHSASTAHELIGGAAAYEAMSAWENHQAKNGKPSSHGEALKIAAGLAGAIVDRMVETKGLDAVDGFERAHAKKKAEQQISEQLQQEYWA